MNKGLQVFKYVFFDLLSAAIAWSLFFFFRKYSFDVYTFDELELIDSYAIADEPAMTTD